MAAVAAGMFLRIAQFAGNPSLWFDEVGLARNVLDRSLLSLIASPLSYGQAAPPLFLVFEKVASLTLGPTDYALRAFPFIASVASLLGFVYLASRMLSPAAAVLSTTLCAFAFPLIYFTTQAKQYSSDVLVTVCFLAAALRVRTSMSPRQTMAFAVAGAALPWLSYSGILVAIAVGIVVLVSALGTEWRVGRGNSSAIVALTWLASATAALGFSLSLVSPETRDYLHRFWDAGFFPATIADLRRTWWPWNQLNMFIGLAPGGGRVASFLYPLPAIYLAGAVAGVYSLWRRDRFTASLIASPVLVALAAAAARQYPFSDRLILFLAPCLLLALGALFDTLSRQVASPVVHGAFALAILIPSLYPTVRQPPPYSHEPVKAVLQAVESRRSPDDVAYVYYGAVPAVDIYVRQLRLAQNAYYAGGCHRGDPRAYLRELDVFRGRARVWIVVTHPYSDERQDILNYADAIGTRRDSVRVSAPRASIPGGVAEAFLYELSDPQRLQAGRSSTFELSSASNPSSLRGCQEGPASIMASRLTPIE